MQLKNIIHIGANKRPARIILGVQAAVGGNGDHIEGGVAQGSGKVGIGALEVQEQCDTDAAASEHAQDRLGLGIAKIRHHSALAPREKMRGEVQGRQNGETGQHQLDGQRIEMSDAGVIGREAAERERGKSVAHGIEPVHAGEPQAQDANRGQPGIHRPQQFGGLADARRELAVLHRARHFGAVNLHAADAEHGQDRHRQHDDAHAAQPAQEMAPQIDRARQQFKPRQHGAAGGRQARRRLEVSLREIDRQIIPQRKSRHRRQRDPGERHQHQAVAGLELALEAPCGQPQQRAENEGGERGDDEGRERGIHPHTAMTNGASMVAENTIMTRANTWATGSKMSFTEKRRSLERVFRPPRCGGGPSGTGSNDRPAAPWCRDAR